MKIKQLLAFAGISMLTMSNSCDKKQVDGAPCPTGPVESTLIAGLPGSPGTFSAAGESKSYVVDSEAQYAALFGSGQLPVIDFNRFTLLTGKISSSSGGYVASQQVVQTCKGYTCTVRIGTGPATVALPIPYSILVPKLSPNAQVMFDVQLIP